MERWCQWRRHPPPPDARTGFCISVLSMLGSGSVKWNVPRGRDATNRWSHGTVHSHRSSAMTADADGLAVEGATRLLGRPVLILLARWRALITVALTA
ncbi:hypothetical protein BRADI_2g06605v3 [Brachypodium distachyon]|uniref:Uncharacterized protein n=1 Tax=Brachypodium distachyon TaxID=15368 RepID=A0A2K2D791_BRADI|nr:hypothetical protein BRADI_2g06605v3 [Brachypodium distachyon]